MADYIGRQLGNYQLTRLLGEGAFAQVYLGEHIYLSTQAAIKVLKIQTTDYPLDLFRLEARNIAHLVHPNIVRVLEFGVEDNVPFLVLDYAPYGTLRQHHPSGTILPVSMVVSYVKQMAEALQYAHDEKLIHRDVKPENMLLGRRREVLLSDFGIALMVQTMHYQNVQDVAGTLPYMSPEQIQGQPRPASDQYSLGVIAYEWLTGKRPFNGSMVEIISQHIASSPLNLLGKMPAASAAVEQAVMIALEKDPNKRFGSVRAFGIALEQASQAGLSLAVRASTNPSFVAGPVSEALPPSEGVVSQRNALTSPVFPSSGSLVRLGPVGSIVCSYGGHVRPVRSISWSPDSMRIISASDEKAAHVWDAATGNKYQVYEDMSEVVRVVAWSSDGSSMAAVGGDGQVWVWDFGANRAIMVYRGHEGGGVNALAWSPNQRLLASGAGDGTVHVWDAMTGQPRTMYRGHSGGVNALAWSPNGSSQIVSGGDDTSLQTWDVFTGRNLSVYHGQSAKVLGVAWSPEAYFLSSRSGRSSRVACGRADGMVQMWDTTVEREVLSYRYPAPVGIVAWSPDGRCFAYGSDNKTVEVWDTRTNIKLWVCVHTAPVRVLAWSPNSKYIASGGGDMHIQVWVAPEPKQEK